MSKPSRGWWYSIAAALLLTLALTAPAWARYLTHVSATVKDSSNNPYAGGSGNISLVVPPGTEESPQVHECDVGGPGSGFQSTYTITRLDSFGAFTLDLPDNACITPAGTQWRFNFCDSTGKICFTVDLTITGATQDITTELQAAAAPLGAVPAGEVPGDLIPATSGFNLGSAAKRWDLFAADLNVSGNVTGVVPASRSITATSPLTGGGDLSADRSIGCPTASSSQAGCLSAADWYTFKGKAATGSCSNQFVTAISYDAAPTCTTATLASGQFANQGTTTTVLHGNASGNPSWAGVSLTADTTPNQGTTTTVLHGNAAGQPSFGPIVSADITDGTVAVADVVAVLKTRQLGFMVGADDGAALADTADQADIYVNRLGQSVTITEVWCASDAGSPVIQLQKDDGSPTNMLSANLACAAGAGASTASFVSGENAIANGDRIDFLMVTAGGTAKRVTVYVRYALD